MAESKTVTKAGRPSRNGAGAGPLRTFTDAERAAMKERARERRAEAARGGKAGKQDGERDLLAKVAEMGSGDRPMAEALHALVKATAPDLTPRTWYGMPAYAKDGKVLCYFKPAEKFKTRYATLGFSDTARLDDGAMWPTEYAVHAWTADVASRVEALVRRAVG